MLPRNQAGNQNRKLDQTEIFLQEFSELHLYFQMFTHRSHTPNFLRYSLLVMAVCICHTQMNPTVTQAHLGKTKKTNVAPSTSPVTSFPGSKSEFSATKSFVKSSASLLRRILNSLQKTKDMLLSYQHVLY